MLNWIFRSFLRYILFRMVYRFVGRFAVAALLTAPFVWHYVGLERLHDLAVSATYYLQ
jgi:hypothetical protein